MLDQRTDITERGTHDNGLIAMLLIVVKDLGDRLDTRVLVTLIILACRLLVPIKDLVVGPDQQTYIRPKLLRTYPSDEWRDKGNTGLSTSHSLTEAEEKGKITVDTVFTFEFAGGLDTLPG